MKHIDQTTFDRIHNEAEDGKRSINGLIAYLRRSNKT